MFTSSCRYIVKIAEINQIFVGEKFGDCRAPTKIQFEQHVVALVLTTIAIFWQITCLLIDLSVRAGRTNSPQQSWHVISAVWNRRKPHRASCSSSKASFLSLVRGLPPFLLPVCMAWYAFSNVFSRGPFVI